MKRISFILLVGLVLITSAAAQMGNFNQRGKATQELKTEGLTIAHPSLPMDPNQKIRVENTVTGKFVEATVVARIPASRDRIADLSAGVWQELGLSPDTEIRIYTPPVARTRPPAAPPPPADTPSASTPVAVAPSQTEPPKENTAPPSAGETAKVSSGTGSGDEDGEGKLPFNLTINTFVGEKGSSMPYGSADADFLAWALAMMMDARDSRDSRDSRESREAREARESRDARDIREARERELRDQREARERELRDTHESRERELRNARETRERELAEARDTREVRERKAREERERRAQEERIAKATPPVLITQPPEKPASKIIVEPASEKPTPEKPAHITYPPEKEDTAACIFEEPAPQYRVTRPKAVPFDQMQIIPGIPDPNSGKLYRLQVVSFSLHEAADLTVKYLENNGFSAIVEKSETSMYRVVVEDIKASDITYAIEKIGALGIGQVWVKEKIQG